MTDFRWIILGRVNSIKNILLVTREFYTKAEWVDSRTSVYYLK